MYNKPILIMIMNEHNCCLTTKLHHYFLKGLSYCHFWQKLALVSQLSPTVLAGIHLGLWLNKHMSCIYFLVSNIHIPSLINS